MKRSKTCRECGLFKEVYAKSSKKCKDCVDKSLTGRVHKMNKQKLMGRVSYFENCINMPYNVYKDKVESLKKDGVFNGY